MENWEYRPGGVVITNNGMGFKSDSWTLDNRGKVWRTVSNVLPFEAYWDEDKKSERFENLKAAQIHIEEQTKEI